MATLKEQTARSVKWLVGASFLQKALSFGTMVILARILDPSIFGLFALAFIAIDGLGMFKSMGFDSALIQRKRDIDKAANTAFIIIPALGISLAIILAVIAPYIGNFLNNKDIIPIIRVLGLIFIFSCFRNVPQMMLQREMHFAKVAVSESASQAVYSIISIILALYGFGIWSLVIGYIVKTMVQMSMIWHFCKWKPKLEFDLKIALEMFHFGKFLFLSSLIFFLKMNLDNIMVGKLLGIAALGMYAVAFNISNFTADYFGNKVQRTTFPVFSKLQNDPEGLRRASLKVLKHSSIVALPIAMGIFLLSKEFLLLVYGQKWIGAAGVLSILAWTGVFRSVNLGPIFSACGKPKYGFWILSLQVALFFIFIAPAARLFGMNGVGIVVVATGCITWALRLTVSARLISIKPRQIYHSLKPALVSSTLMAVGIIFLKNLLLYFRIMAFTHLTFILVFILAAAIYGFSLFRVERSLFKEIKGLVFA